MPFLELNGLSIPIADGSSSSTRTNIGKRSRAFDGTLLTSRRARKHVSTHTTNQVTEMVAAAIEGAVAGLGSLWPFNFSDDANLTEDFFGSKGEALISSSVGAMYFGTGADGDPVSNAAGERESQFGSGSASGEVAVTNLIATANERDVEEGTSGFTGLGTPATLATDTDNFIQGSQSLEVTTSAIDDGVEVTAVSASSATDYSASVYIKTTVARAMRLRLLDVTNATSTDTDLTTVADTWHRVTVTHTTGGSATTIKLQVFDRDSGGTVFFVDALQMEQLSISTAWADPTRIRSAPLYSPGDFSASNGDVTVNVWARSTTATFSSTRTLISLQSLPVAFFDHLMLTRPGSATTMRFISRSKDGTAELVTSSFVFDDDWHMFTGVLRRNPETGENALELYVDGVTDGTPVVSAPKLVDLTAVGQVMIGDFINSLWKRIGNERIDDAMVVPWAATAAQVLGWFSMGVAMSKLPRLRMTGDLIPDTFKTVDGFINSQDMIVGVESGVSKTNLSKLKFTLEEV